MEAETKISDRSFKIVSLWVTLYLYTLIFTVPEHTRIIHMF